MRLISKSPLSPLFLGIALVAACATSNTSDESSAAGSGGSGVLGGSTSATNAGGATGSGGAGGIASAGMAGTGGSGASAVGGMGGSAQTTTTTTTTATTTTGGGNAPLVPTPLSHGLYINCQPVVGQDPIHGDLMANYDNSANTQSGVATLNGAKLMMVDGAESLTWKFSVTPTTSSVVPAGQVTQVLHTKVANSGAPSGMGVPCDYCQGQWTLETSFSVNNSTILISLPASAVSCVF